MNIILFGPPAAGKGTQANLLARKLGVPHVASGDLFREHQEKNTDLGRQARSYMERGVLVPDDVTIKMILERLEQPDCNKGFVLDGFPRTLDQAKTLGQALAKKGQAIDRVLNLKVSQEELIRRISGRMVCRACQTSYHRDSSPPKVAGRCDKCNGALYQREDDTPQAARRRLMVYEEVTQPLIKYYKDSGKLENVDGNNSITEVTKAIDALAATRA